MQPANKATTSQYFQSRGGMFDLYLILVFLFIRRGQCAVPTKLFFLMVISKLECQIGRKNSGNYPEFFQARMEWLMRMGEQGQLIPVLSGKERRES